MKEHHILELLTALGMLVFLGFGAYFYHETTRIDTTTSNLQVTTTGAVETLDSTRYSSKPASETISALIVGLYARDAKGRVVSAIAAPHPVVSTNKKTNVFTLRPYHWTNGQRVTANDFVYAWRRLAAPKTQSRNASRIDFIQNGMAVRTGKLPVTALGVRALSSTQLEVKLAEANPYLKEILADTPLLPINEAFADKMGTAYGDSATHILPDGPYRLTGWSGFKDKTWRYVRNPTYYHAKHVHVKTVDFKIQTDTARAAKQFVQGRLDYTPLAPQQVPRFKDNRSLRTQATTTEAFLFFNTTTGPTTNLALRKAIAQAFDKHDFTQSQLGDGAMPLNGLVPANLTQMTNGMDYRKTTGELLPYDLPKATAAWNQAKTQMRIDRLHLTLTIADNDTARLAGNFLKRQLEHNLPGMTITIKKVTLEQRVALEAAGKFELVFSTWSPDDSDPMNLLAFYQTGSRMNITGYTNAKFDQQVAAIEAAGTDPGKRLQLVQQAERYLMTKEVPAAGFFQDGAAYLLSDKVKTFPVMPSGTINYEYVQIR